MASALRTPQALDTPAVQPSLASNLGFIFFLLVNLTLFIRPGELLESLAGYPIYEVLILAALLFSAPDVLRQFSLPALINKPISVFVFMIMLAILVTGVCDEGAWTVRTYGWEFFKVILYYLLLVSLLDSPQRLRWFLFALVIFTLIVSLIALLRWHGFIEISSLTAMEQREWDPVQGRMKTIIRLRATGIFNDPNDLCMMLLTAIAACAYAATRPGLGARRLLWCVPFPFLLYAFALTHSRGGFIALTIASLFFLRVRFGWRKAIGLAAVGLPVLFVVFAGRQTNISTDDTTGQERIQLWSQGLSELRQHPLLGIGPGSYRDHMMKVAHNSYIHAVTELGFVGGTFFVGAFAMGLIGLYRVRPAPGPAAASELWRLQPYLGAMLASVATTILMLSRDYVVPTYVVLGIVSCWFNLVRGTSARPPARLSVSLLVGMFLITVILMVVLMGFTHLAVHFGD